MQKDVDPLPSQGALHLWKARSKLATESKSVLDCPAVVDESLLLGRELHVESLVNALEHVSTANPMGVLDIHLPRERPLLEDNEHLGHSAIGRWFVELVLEDDLIYWKGHIEAEESLRSS